MKSSPLTNDDSNIIRLISISSSSYPIIYCSHPLVVIFLIWRKSMNISTFSSSSSSHHHHNVPKKRRISYQITVKLFYFIFEESRLLHCCALPHSLSPFLCVYMQTMNEQFEWFWKAASTETRYRKMLWIKGSWSEASLKLKCFWCVMNI